MRLQVPFVAWMFPVKLRAGGKLDRFVAKITQRLFRNAGKQLFLEDRDPKATPSQEELKQQSVDNKLPDEGDSAPVDTASTSIDHTPPLIAKLAFDVPGEGFFYSALKVRCSLLFRSFLCKIPSCCGSFYSCLLYNVQQYIATEVIAVCSVLLATCNVHLVAKFASCCCALVGVVSSFVAVFLFRGENSAVTGGVS